jgi:hypothetical protein
MKTMLKYRKPRIEPTLICFTPILISIEIAKGSPQTLSRKTTTKQLQNNSTHPTHIIFTADQQIVFPTKPKEFIKMQKKK